jgi:YesN/AraC family two-component response regulator
LLLTDLIMPGMNGQDLKEAIQKKNPGICYLYISGYPPHVLGRHGILSKETHFLQKPFKQTTLANKIRAVLDEEI